MGMLVDGTWEKSPVSTNNDNGEFVRKDSIFRHTLSEQDAVAGRYHLYISHACPWAHRTMVMRKLKGLENVISYSPVNAFMGDEGWTFSESGETVDPLHGFTHLHQIYTKANHKCTTKVTVPILWDKKEQTIINNESSEIIRILNSSFNKFAEKDYDAYPEKWRHDIDEINSFVYERINNGVYRCGFSTTQDAYNEAFDRLFSALDVIESRLSKQDFLVSENPTEADWRLFTTLLRFDPVYVYHFKCNLKRIQDFPNLSAYLKRLYHYPGIEETVRLDHIKQHYYKSHPDINPTGIIPKGPLLNW